MFPDSLFSAGDFQDITPPDCNPPSVRTKAEKTVQGEGDIEASADNGNGLFSCPVKGCVRAFQRHCNLERHIHYGKYKFVEEKHSFLDRENILYAEKLQEGGSAQHFIAGAVLSEQSVQVLPKRLPESVPSKKPIWTKDLK